MFVYPVHTPTSSRQPRFTVRSQSKHRCPVHKDPVLRGWKVFCSINSRPLRAANKRRCACEHHLAEMLLNGLFPVEDDLPSTLFPTKTVPKRHWTELFFIDWQNWQKNNQVTFHFSLLGTFIRSWGRFPKGERVWYLTHFRHLGAEPRGNFARREKKWGHSLCILQIISYFRREKSQKQW